MLQPVYTLLHGILPEFCHGISTPAISNVFEQLLIDRFP